MSALHTHEPGATLHIEANLAGDVFTLGQLFTQWGVQLSTSQIDGVKTTARHNVSVTSNGIPSGGDHPQDLRLQPDQQIVLELP